MIIARLNSKRKTGLMLPLALKNFHMVAHAPTKLSQSADILNLLLTIPTLIWLLLLTKRNGAIVITVLMTKINSPMMKSPNLATKMERLSFT